MKIKMQNQVKVKRLDEGYKEFIKYCRAKNLADKTIDYYEECIDEFSKFYGNQVMINTIDKDAVESYILHLKANTSMNSTSINTRLRGIRAIFYYFMELEYLDKFKIKMTKAEKRIKDTYSDAEIKLLLIKPDIKKCNFAEYRTWVIENYLISTGNRASSLLNIKIGDIDFIENTILLQKTKNKRQQVVPLSRTLSKVLAEYLKYRDGNVEDYLFCSTYGCKLTLSALENSIRKYNSKRGVNKSSVHLFRNYFAKAFILAGGDAFRLQALLGHSSLDMVKEYVNIYGNDLQKDYNRFNPLELISDNKEYRRMR